MEQEKTPLMNAIENGDHDTLTLLINQGTNVNEICPMGSRPLDIAIRSHNLDAVKQLLLKGVEVNSRNGRGEMPLMIVLSDWLDAEETQSYALRFYCASPVKNSDILNKFWDVVKLLLDHGAFTNIVSDRGETPLTLAVVDRFTERASGYSQAGVCEPGNGGNSALVHAGHSARLEVVKLLIDYGACVNTANWSGKTPLMCAVCNKTVNSLIVKHLLDRGGIVDAVDNTGKSALYHAIFNEALEAIELLIKYGVSVNTLNKEGTTPLIYVINSSTTADAVIVKLLLDVGAFLDVTDKDGQTALIHAIKLGKHYLVELLLDYGACADGVEESGENPVILAAKTGKLMCLIVLVIKRVNLINAADKHGFTALMYLLKLSSKRRNFERALDVLLKKGASVSAVSNDGTTPIELFLSTFRPSFLLDYSFFSAFRKLLNCRPDLGMPPSGMVCSCLLSMLFHKDNETAQRMIQLGCLPRRCLFGFRMAQMRSPVEITILSSNRPAFKFLLANHYFTQEDVQLLATRYRDTIKESELYAAGSANRLKRLAKIKLMIDSLTQQPLRLYSLCFIVVSSILERYEQDPGLVRTVKPTTAHKVNTASKLSRRDKVNCLPLPPYIKRALLFQTQNVDIDPKLWNLICLDSGKISECGCSDDDDDDDDDDDYGTDDSDQ